MNVQVGKVPLIVKTNHQSVANLGRSYPDRSTLKYIREKVEVWLKYNRPTLQDNFIASKVAEQKLVGASLR